MTSLTDDIFTFLNERGIPLEVLSFSGAERVSGDYTYSIELRGSPDVEVSDAERSLLGRRGVLGLGGTTPLAELLAPKPLISPLLDKKGRAWDGTIEREVHGVVLGVRMTSAKNRSHLWVELGPRLALLRHRRRSRIFQGQSVIETVKQVLDEWHLRHRLDLSGTYPRKAYTTQYQETDYDFVTRLLSEAGVLFWFDQPSTGKVEDEEELVLSDDATFYPKLPRGDALSFWNGHMEAKESELMELSLVRSFRPKVAYVGDFDFRKPALPLRAASKAEVSTKPSGELIETFEWYSHDAGVEDELGGGVDINERLAARRVEQLRRDATLAEGLTKSRKMAPGYAFDLDEHPLDGMNTRWVVTSVEQRGKVPEKAQSDEVFQAKIVLAPAEVTVRPPPPDSRARQVTETATVVGPSGEEIFTDEHGRVKVQFHWDREGKRDEHSSAWLRVAQAWTGARFGSQFIPRIGTEVVVTFLGGDVDRPLITGSVYNATHPPPFDLPAQKTRSGLKTASSPGSEGHNELSFEDDAGREQVYLHAQRDYDLVVKRDHTARVERNEVRTVLGTHTETIVGAQTITVSATKSETIALDLSTNVGGSVVTSVANNAQTNITGSLVERIEGGVSRSVVGPSEVSHVHDSTLRVEGHAVTIVGTSETPTSSTLFVQGTTTMTGTGITEITSDRGIVLRVGDSVVAIGPKQIELSTPKLVFTTERLLAATDELRFFVDEEAVLKAPKILLKSEGAGVELTQEARIDGASVKLNCAVDDASPFKPETSKPTKISLVDQDHVALAKQRFTIVLPDGTERAGVLDEEGKATVWLDASGEIVFPDVDGPTKE